MRLLNQVNIWPHLGWPEVDGDDECYRDDHREGHGRDDDDLQTTGITSAGDRKIYLRTVARQPKEGNTNNTWKLRNLYQENIGLRGGGGDQIL